MFGGMYGFLWMDFVLVGGDIDFDNDGVMIFNC